MTIDNAKIKLALRSVNAEILKVKNSGTSTMDKMKTIRALNDKKQKLIKLLGDKTLF